MSPPSEIVIKGQRVLPCQSKQTMGLLVESVETRPTARSDTGASGVWNVKGVWSSASTSSSPGTKPRKGSHTLRQLWEVLKTRYVRGESIDGQNFQILPRNRVDEIKAATDENHCARLICDYLAGMTYGYADRTYKTPILP